MLVCIKADYLGKINWRHGPSLLSTYSWVKTALPFLNINDFLLNEPEFHCHYIFSGELVLIFWHLLLTYCLLWYFLTFWVLNIYQFHIMCKWFTVNSILSFSKGKMYRAGEQLKSQRRNSYLPDKIRFLLRCLIRVFLPSDLHFDLH